MRYCWESIVVFLCILQHWSATIIFVEQEFLIWLLFFFNNFSKDTIDLVFFFFFFFLSIYLLYSKYVKDSRLLVLTNSVLFPSTICQLIFIILNSQPSWERNNSSGNGLCKFFTLLRNLTVLMLGSKYDYKFCWIYVWFNWET